MTDPAGFYVRLPRELARAIRVDAAKLEKPLWVWMMEAAMTKLPREAREEIAPID